MRPQRMGQRIAQGETVAHGIEQVEDIEGQRHRPMRPGQPHVHLRITALRQMERTAPDPGASGILN